MTERVPSQARRRRSALYVPAINARALAKAAGLPVDVIIVDLEDAIAIDSKQAAREGSLSAADRLTGKEVAFRVNALGTQWHVDDMAAAVTAGVQAVVVPKVESPEDVAEVARTIASIGGSPDLQIWPMIESPKAVLAVNAIAIASSRITTIVIGVNDLVNDLRARHVPGRLPVVPHLAACVLAARLAEVDILDGVYNDITDGPGFAAECAQGRDFGFSGKTLIHPSQVDACNAAFSPTYDELTVAREILDAWTKAQAQGKGVVTVRGKMVENLHVADARRVLALDGAIPELQATQDTSG